MAQNWDSSSVRLTKNWGFCSLKLKIETDLGKPLAVLLPQEQGPAGGDPGEGWAGPAALCSGLWLQEHPEPGAEAEEREVPLSLRGGHGLSLR